MIQKYKISIKIIAYFYIFVIISDILNILKLISTLITPKITFPNTINNYSFINICENKYLDKKHKSLFL